jgi:tetratricopeptide (TPR) repeat protein
MSTGTTIQSRKARKKLIKVAEGYLELMTMFEDRWPLDPSLVEVLADRTIETLDKTASLKKPKDSRARKRLKTHICVLKGQACRIARRYDRAISFFEQVLELDAEDFDTLLAIAWCYKRTERLRDAIKALETLIGFEPTSPIAHYNLACYLALAKEADRSILHLSSAIEFDEALRENAEAESDFDPIRETQEFVTLMTTPIKKSKAV